MNVEADTKTDRNQGPFSSVLHENRSRAFEPCRSCQKGGCHPSFEGIFGIAVAETTAQRPDRLLEATPKGQVLSPGGLKGIRCMWLDLREPRRLALLVVGFEIRRYMRKSLVWDNIMGGTRHTKGTLDRPAGATGSGCSCMVCPITSARVAPNLTTKSLPKSTSFTLRLLDSPYPSKCIDQGIEFTSELLECKDETVSGSVP
jgi:hypothetical protein